MGRYPEIKIFWSYPRSIQSFIDKYDEFDRDFLYYVISRPKINRKVLYIGQSTRSIRDRIKDHDEKWLWQHFGEHKVSAGYFTWPKDVSLDHINDAERALIYLKQPPANTKLKKSFNPTAHYKIINEGNRGLLPKQFYTVNL